MGLLSRFPLGLVAFALLVRWLVSQFPYSGQGKPPIFGDYEAQRHWMEVTTNLPVEGWYQNSTDNDLMYWGLDYPPLTAYHMFLLGKISESLNSTWTELHQSRGTESHNHKLFMRMTVIIPDLLIYLSAIIYYFRKTSFGYPVNRASGIDAYVSLAFVLLYPGQILIDHGHFQYNCVFMGLVLWAIILLIDSRQATSATLFTLALGYKQMSLYYALPFFWFIASSNLRVKPLWKGIRNILLIGFVVVSNLALLFMPYVTSLPRLMQVFKRIFPFNRGLFEDKVANVWFSLSLAYKFRDRHSTEELLRFSTIATLLVTLPSGLHLLFKPSLRAFRYALITTSLSFFLLSFQVHEKTILVPALPILLLVREHPLAVSWFSIVSTFSLQPLLIRDGQTVPYFVLITISIILIFEVFREHLRLSEKRWTLHNLIIITFYLSALGCTTLSILALTLEPPTRYPDIHPTINAFYCCIHLIGFLLFFYYKQFYLGNQNFKRGDVVRLIKKTQ